MTRNPTDSPDRSGTGAQQEDQQEDHREGTRAGRLYFPWWTPVALCLIFFITLNFQEWRVLRLITLEETPMAKFSWRSLWPLAWMTLALFLPWRSRWSLLGVSATFSLLLMAIEAGYWSFFHTITRADLLIASPQLVDMWQSVKHLARPDLLLPLAVVPLFFIYAAWGSTRTRPIPEAERQSSFATLFLKARTWAVLFLVLFGLQYLSAVRSPIYEKTHHLGRPSWVLPKNHWGSKFSNTIFARTYGLYNFHVVDLKGFLSRLRNQPQWNEDDRKAIKELLLHKYALNQTVSPFFGLAEGRNVVLVQLESFQHFVLGLEVGGHTVTPVLNGLRDGSLNFDYTLDITMGGRTSDAEFAVMTGLFPDPELPLQLTTISPHLTALPKRLSTLGFETLAFHGYEVSFWNRDYAFPRYGFEHMLFKETYAGMESFGLGASDESVFDYSVKRMASSKSQAFFSFISTLSSHHPFVYVPDEYQRPFINALPNHALTGPYLGSVSYTDEALGVFLGKMKEAGLSNNTLYVIYGDHDHGFAGTRQPIPQVGPKMFSVEEDRVPLMFLIPGQETFIRQNFPAYQSTFATLRDVYPTILHLLGVDPTYTMTGTHLFVPEIERDPAPYLIGCSTVYYRGVLAKCNDTPWAPHGLPNEPIDWAAMRQLAFLQATTIMNFSSLADSQIVQFERQESTPSPTQ